MAWDKGFNFRSTSGYVTDGTNESPVLAEVFPHTYGNGASAGWSSAPTKADRNSANDRRLAGVHTTSNTGAAKTFTVTLPATGDYLITLALGDASFSQNTAVVIKDNTTTLITIPKTNTAGNSFMDGLGISHTAATWTGTDNGSNSNANRTSAPIVVRCTFATTTLVISLGANDATGTNSAIAHLFVSQAYSSFTYNRSLTIDHTKCGASDSSNFPVLVKISDATLKDSGNGGHVQSTSGYDICFFSDSGSTTALTWEIDCYDNVNGVLWAWVKIPTVSHTSDTVFYIFYGNSSVAQYQSTGQSVWDSNYKGVWHLPNGTTLTASDSTSNGIGKGTLSGTPPAITGQIDGGAGFTAASTQYIDAGTPVINYASLTVSQWIKGSSVVGTSVTQWSDANTFENFLLDWNGGSGHARWIVKDGGTGITTVNGTSNLADGSWHYVVGTFTSGSGNVIVYVDGASQNTGTASGANVFGPASAHLYFGRYVDGAYLTGSLDEIRISNSVRGADWILTEYNNQNAPGTFITMGAEPSTGHFFLSGILNGLGAGGPFFQNPLG